MHGRNPIEEPAVFAAQLPASTDLRALHRLNPARYPFLLQSTAVSADLGRYDILFAFPGDSLVLDEPGQLSGPQAGAHVEFLVALDEWWRSERTATNSAGLPFSGGWFLFLGYELAAEVEPALALQPDPILPTAFAVRCPAALIRDHSDGSVVYVAESTASRQLDNVRADIAAAADVAGTVRTADPQVDEEPAQQFLDAVITAKKHIARGDIYQANLSRGWSAQLPGDADAMRIYESLCDANPGPFAGIVRWQNTCVISSSPERLLQVRDDVVSTRPIAGTRPRSDDKSLDDALLAELIAHPKERAEHVMLIDLERNDLGRVCRAGTVRVNEMMVIESYAHVHHIVSNVEGVKRDNVTPGDCIRAVFPGGTITGCPKVRCMEIIADLESGPRGAYTGSFGYLNLDGSMDLNILIRTMVMRDNEITLRAGSGIVADSEPEAELAETRAKAKGLIKALSR